MASTQPGPATPGLTSSFSSRFELLHDVRLDAERVNAALAGVMELLQGCRPDHQLTAGKLDALLEPVWAGLDTLCGDLRTATNQGERPC